MTDEIQGTTQQIAIKLLTELAKLDADGEIVERVYGSEGEWYDNTKKFNQLMRNVNRFLWGENNTTL